MQKICSGQLAANICETRFVVRKLFKMIKIIRIDIYGTDVAPHGQRAQGGWVLLNIIVINYID